MENIELSKAQKRVMIPLLESRISHLTQIDRFVDDLDPESATELSILKNLVKQLKRRPRKIPYLLRIVDWTKDKHEPAYDVELYINGEFDGTHDGVFSTDGVNGKLGALENAINHARLKLLTEQNKVLNQLKLQTCIMK